MRSWMACRMRVKSSPSENPVDGSGKYFTQLSPGLECGIMGEKSKGAVHDAVCQEENALCNPE